MTRNEILRWLRETDKARLEELWLLADRVRREGVGDEVHLRGLIELSNHCVRSCAYCGLRVANAALERYRMSVDEVLACARQAVAFGYGTVVMQAGEDPALAGPWIADVVRRIKRETPLAVTLSLGERSEDDLRLWREAGADRYLLRFETSNRELYDRIHPPVAGRRSDRPALLRMLRAMGYEIGGGAMVGIPGQTYDDLAGDLELCRELDLDMIGLGPYLPHPATPLGQGASMARLPRRDDQDHGTHAGEEDAGATAAVVCRRADGEEIVADQAPNDELTTYKMVALARLACPRANIPSTTALATLNLASGRELGLCRGANVVMPNLTPTKYRALYEIYPSKACIRETAEQCQMCLAGRIASIGRVIGRGRGDSPRRAAAESATEGR